MLGLGSAESCMAAVQLPANLLSANGPSGSTAAAAISDSAAALHALLRQQYSIEVPVLAMLGALWVRISAQVYNSLAEYRRLAEAVLEVAARGLLAAAAPGSEEEEKGQHS